MIYLFESKQLIDLGLPNIDEAVVNDDKLKAEFLGRKIELQTLSIGSSKKKGVERIPRVKSAQNKEIKVQKDLIENNKSKLTFELNPFFYPWNFKRGDVIIVYSIFIISETLSVALKNISMLLDNEIRVISINEKFDSNNDSNFKNFYNTYFSFIKSFDNISKFSKIKKQQQGFEKARQNGIKLGTEAYKPNDFPLFFRYYKEWKANLITKTEFARALGVSRPTLDKLIKQTKIES